MPSLNSRRSSRPSRSSSRRSSGAPRGSKSSSGSLAPFAMLGLAGLGAFYLFEKKAGATEGPSSSAKTTPSKPTTDLSEDLKRQMAEALGKLGVSPATGKLSGAADADAIRQATQLVGTLDAMGFHEAATALRKYVDEAAKSVQTPATAAPIAAALPAGLTPAQREYVARVMSLEREPNKIALLIDWLRKLSPSPERDNMIQMAQALALQLAAAQSTAATMDQIDQVMKAPDATAIQKAASAPLPPAYVPSPPPGYGGPSIPANLPSGVVYSPGPSTITSPGIANVPGQGAPKLPENPVVVPSSPVPQPVPVPASAAELAAQAMVANLKAVQAKFGVKGAKGKEDQNLVKKFQGLVTTAQAPIAIDGKAGPTTLVLAAGKGAVDLPFVLYWPSAATAATVAQYRDALGRVADKLASLGRTTDAATLRASAARESGQAGINGPAASPTPSPKPQAPSPSPVKPIDQVIDPKPAWPLIRRGDKDSAAARAAGTGIVTTWQKVLVKGGFLPNAASSMDGAFGPATDAATRKLQAKAGMVASAQDGVVGPNTRKAGNYLGLW